jgi:hypothetical protein
VLIESLTLANVSWYGQKETETNSVMLNNVHFVFFNTKEFHTMAAFIKIQKRNIPMYVRLYHFHSKKQTTRLSSHTPITGFHNEEVQAFNILLANHTKFKGERNPT